MVLLYVVSFQVKALFFKSFFINTTYEAFSFLILNHLFSLSSKRCEVIDQDTSKNISKEHVHKYSVDHVISKSSRFEGIHIFTNLFFDIEFNHTIKDTLTVSIRIFIRVYCVNIVAHRKY